jgi:hypothetical protein
LSAVFEKGVYTGDIDAIEAFTAMADEIGEEKIYIRAVCLDGIGSQPSLGNEMMEEKVPTGSEPMR